MKWSLHLPSAFLSLTPSNHRPGVTRMTTDSHSGGDDGASSSITAVTATPPRESTAPIAPAASASAGKKSSSSRSRRRRRRLFSFAEARRMARGHGFDSREEFHEYSCPGAYQIPKDADVVWKEEWRGWEDFLGVPLSFEESREIARSLDGIDDEGAYLDLVGGGTISDDDAASRLPHRPDRKYKDDWLGWDDFLIG